MMRCIAVDDEKWVLDLLVDNISRVPFLQLAGRCKNAFEATELLHREEVDLIFLDIQMPGLDGIQFVQSLQHPPMIIFVTAYKEHAWEGFELAAVDYLLKPVSFERFLKACNKAQELFRLQQKTTAAKELPASFFCICGIQPGKDQYCRYRVHRRHERLRENISNHSCQTGDH